MRRIAVLVLVGWHVAVAQPAPPAPEPPPPPATTPWLDLSPSVALTNDPAPEPDHPVAAVATLAGFYAAFGAFGFDAWYRQHKPLADYKFGGDGWLGWHTYAGGADKFGHAWSTMALARMGTEILSDWGGYDRTRSMWLSTALSELLFFGVEVSDGFYFEFSWSDFTGDTVGALLALAFMMSPKLDEMFDFRVQYFPSSEYAHDLFTKGAPNRLNIDDDYNGQTYLLAYHLGSIPALREMKYGTLSRFVDLTFGFETRGYKPTPASGPLPAMDHHQNLMIGLSLNAQGVFDWLFEGGHHERARKVLHGFTEVFNVPYSSVTLPGLEWTRTPTSAPTNAE
jgi:hypothetical protein